MKNYLVTILFFLLFTPADSQEPGYNSFGAYVTPAQNMRPKNGNSGELQFEIHGAYTRPVNKTQLHSSKILNDIRPGYPSNWLKDYISTEIQSVSNGKYMHAGSANDTLSPQQIALLNTVDIGDDITIRVQYNSKNAATDRTEIRTMNYTVTVIPEIEAEYRGGHPQLTKYIKENALNKIPTKVGKELQDGIVGFTINEQGETTNTHLRKSTGNSETDKLLLEVIHSMPKWKPAENSKGQKVKQKFEFNVRAENTGC
ncbi:MAG TPA: energy transducer TonB [Bacteroidia bacterium]|nr:energy transducer TonB [Bacteroidia bacterium]